LVSAFVTAPALAQSRAPVIRLGGARMQTRPIPLPRDMQAHRLRPGAMPFDHQTPRNLVQRTVHTSYGMRVVERTRMLRNPIGSPRAWRTSRVARTVYAGRQPMYTFSEHPESSTMLVTNHMTGQHYEATLRQDGANGGYTANFREIDARTGRPGAEVLPQQVDRVVFAGQERPYILNQ
jgi:hypothetical protein